MTGGETKHIEDMNRRGFVRTSILGMVGLWLGKHANSPRQVMEEEPLDKGIAELASTVSSAPRMTGLTFDELHRELAWWASDEQLSEEQIVAAYSADVAERMAEAAKESLTAWVKEVLDA